MEAARRSGPARRTVVSGGLAAAVGTAVAPGLLPDLGGSAAAQGRPHGAAGAVPDSAAAAEPADVYEELLTRWRETVLGGSAPEGECGELYTAAVRDQDETVLRHLESIVTEDGATTPWDDLPLDAEDDLSAHVTDVGNRLRGIALACVNEASALYGDEDAAAAAAAGCRIWWRSRYHAGQESYGNWWDWEIGAPRAVTDTLTLLGDAVDQEVRAGLLDAVDHFVPDPRRMLRDELWSTGANLVDLCRIVALRGALGKNAEKLAQGSSSLAGVLDPVHVGDGFHPDGSFIMHTSVAYPGTYGQVLVQGMAELMRLLSGTEWDVAENERRRTTESIDRTFAPFVHQGLMLDAVRGRAISRNSSTDADDGFKLTVDLITLAGALPEEEADTAERLRSVAKEWLLHNDWRELGDRTPEQIATVATVLTDDAVSPEDGPSGYFGYADMERFVQRRSGWSYCLSLNSDRVARYEYMNGENAHGWHTGDGMVQLVLDRDRYQYTDAYWPTADPKRLPGITVDTAELPVGAGGDNDNVPLSGTRWSGQVELDGTGLAGMDFRGIDSPLRARKSWLFLEDAVLAAGSGITADDGRTIETVVDHRNLHGPNDPDLAEPGTLRIDGQQVPEQLGTTAAHPGVRWAHIGGTGGYVFLDRPRGTSTMPDGTDGTDGTLLSLREDRTGAWSDIRDGGPDTPITRRFLTLWHDHGTEPEEASYAYVQLPGATFSDTAARAAYPGVEVVELNNTVHAFRTTPGGLAAERSATLTALTFFEPGTAASVTADGPCAVLLREERGELQIAVSDPSRSVPVVRLHLDLPQYRAVREAGEAVTVLATGPDGIDLLVETGGSRGASRALTLAPGRRATEHRMELLAAEDAATVRSGRHSGENDGGAAELRVHHADNADDTSRAYLRFRLPDGMATGNVHRAVLWTWGAIPKDPDSRESDMLQHPLRARGPAGEEWTETDITWDNAPAPGPGLATDWVTTYEDWAGLDVTGAVRQSDGTLTITLDQEEEGHETLLDGRSATGNPPLLQVIADV